MSLTVNGNTGEITVTRGDDATVRFTITDQNGNAKDVSAAQAMDFHVKQYLEDASTVFVRSIGTGVDMTQASVGIVDVSIALTNTQNLSGKYFYDLQMLLATKTETVAQGVFVVAKDVA